MEELKVVSIKGGGIGTGSTPGTLLSHSRSLEIRNCDIVECN